jgi:succinate dehydrogenase / fumarate reductase flavoprotein subunit
VKYVRSLSYQLGGATITVDDKVDTNLVTPRERKYEQAGAASAAAAGKLESKSDKSAEKTAAAAS